MGRSLFLSSFHPETVLARTENTWFPTWKPLVAHPEFSGW